MDDDPQLSQGLMEEFEKELGAPGCAEGGDVEAGLNAESIAADNPTTVSELYVQAVAGLRGPIAKMSPFVMNRNDSTYEKELC